MKSFVARTGAVIEHPCGDLEPPLDIRAVNRALEYSAVRFINGGVDEDLAPEPRMVITHRHIYGADFERIRPGFRELFGRG